MAIRRLRAAAGMLDTAGPPDSRFPSSCLMDLLTTCFASDSAGDAADEAGSSWMLAGSCANINRALVDKTTTPVMYCMEQSQFNAINAPKLMSYMQKCRRCFVYKKLLSSGYRQT